MTIDVIDKTFPVKVGIITFSLTELDCINLLADLESESKNHRNSTICIKNVLKEFIEEIKKRFLNANPKEE